MRERTRVFSEEKNDEKTVNRYGFNFAVACERVTIRDPDIKKFPQKNCSPPLLEEHQQRTIKSYWDFFLFKQQHQQEDNQIFLTFTPYMNYFLKVTSTKVFPHQFHISLQLGHLPAWLTPTQGKKNNNLAKN